MRMETDNYRTLEVVADGINGGILLITGNVGEPTKTMPMHLTSTEAVALIAAMSEAHRQAK